MTATEKKGEYWKRRYEPMCDGDCFKCIHSDCIVPAITIQAEKYLTSGGVKTPYVIEKNLRGRQKPSKVYETSSKRLRDENIG